MNRPQARDADGCFSRRASSHVDKRIAVLPFNQLSDKIEDSVRRDRTLHIQSRVGSLPDRSGQTLVEFALVALVLYMLLAAILTFGHLLFVAQNLQTAADLAARELSRTPLSVDSTFGDALCDQDVRRDIYDVGLLVINLDIVYRNMRLENFPSTSAFEYILPKLPWVNRQLFSSMIVETVDLDGDGVAETRLLRYPGTLMIRESCLSCEEQAEGCCSDWALTDYTVRIPLIDVDESGAELIHWLPVVEGLKVRGSEAGSLETSEKDPFVLTEDLKSGVVALRINYPLQPTATRSVEPITANLPECETPKDGVFRPYRRVVSAQAIYRREIFGD